ncbi:hypothetical protein [Actinomadura verrucosospora]|uniref:Cellulosome anchoring protein cohesin subunit n=1 Tax=Actinomadura verrucosospora TaxID=46165 RepID=A0A7D4A6Z0_ACTVE|nr:hypothetical protein [Actinomadura verrucosospora]QKG24085.1 cellulosome anchoring protein cohesin subunit [Actinomadura verrucosospora]
MRERRLITRIAVGGGAAGLAVAMTGCGTGTPRAPRPTRAAPVAANWPLKCDDPRGDVTARGSRKPAPPGSDLTSVAWERGPDILRVAFTTAGPPGSTGSGSATYTTVIRDGSRTSRIDATFAGGQWRVSGGPDGKDLGSGTSLDGDTVMLSLPGRVPAEHGTIDVGRRLDVSASSQVKVDEGVYEDAGCSASAPRGGGTRHYLTFPIERDTPTPWRSTPRWRTTKTKRPPSSPTTHPAEEPTHTSTPAAPRPTHRATTRPRPPSKPRTHR